MAAYSVYETATEAGIGQVIDDFLDLKEFLTCRQNCRQGTSTKARNPRKEHHEGNGRRFWWSHDALSCRSFRSQISATTTGCSGSSRAASAAPTGCPYTGEFLGGMFKPPLILGHEIVGRIARIGDAAARRWGVREGDRVILEEPIPCGNCAACRVGRFQACGADRYGTKPVASPPSLWGGYSDYVYLAPAAIMHKIPEEIPVELAPLFVPLSNGAYWVEEIGGLHLGQTVVIQGPGQHGLGCVIAAKEAGAGCVIVTGPRRIRPTSSRGGNGLSVQIMSSASTRKTACGESPRSLMARWRMWSCRSPRGRPRQFNSSVHLAADRRHNRQHRYGNRARGRLRAGRNHLQGAHDQRRAWAL